MKKLTILLFSILISFSSYAGWFSSDSGLKKILTSAWGSTYYIDTDTIKEYDGYVYYWSLEDFVKPNHLFVMSSKSYHQADCKRSRYKFLSSISYFQPMGTVQGDSSEGTKLWRTASDGTVGGALFNYACGYIKEKLQ